MAITFQVRQSVRYAAPDGIGTMENIGNAYEGTLAGAKRALAHARRMTYGQEPGRLAPRASGFVVVLVDGKLLRTNGGYTTFTLAPADIQPDYRPEKTRFAEFLAAVESAR